MKHITQAQFSRLPLPEKTAVYMTHSLNTREGMNHSQGPSVTAQAAFHSNWLEAFADFEQRLPTK